MTIISPIKTQNNGLETSLSKDKFDGNESGLIKKLQSTIDFLVTHIPGASEVAELHENETLILNVDKNSKVENKLISKSQCNNKSNEGQQALDSFKKARLTNLEIGRLYERYIGYLKEIEGYHVTYKGIIDGFDDLGRDIICFKGKEHIVIQTKCWSKKKQIRENAIFQLYGTLAAYRMQLRESIKTRYGKREASKRMRELDIKAVLCSTTDLSETAKMAAKFCQIGYDKVPLDKNYPMIKCNVSKLTGEKIFHLPFDPAYDKIIIGNQPGEKYVNSVLEAEALGFKRVKQIN